MSTETRIIKSLRSALNFKLDEAVALEFFAKRQRIFKVNVHWNLWNTWRDVMTLFVLCPLTAAFWILHYVLPSEFFMARFWLYDKHILKFFLYGTASRINYFEIIY